MRAFGWFLTLIAAALAAIAVFTYPAWLLLYPHFHFPFHRVGERIGMLALVVGFLAIARRLKLADRESLGYGLARRSFLRELLIALGLGVVTMMALVGIMSALGLLDWRAATGLDAARWARLITACALSALAVALIEETFLRGAMHSAIERESGARAAVLLTALIYSASHFFARFHIEAAQVTPWSGVTLLAGTLHSFSHPASILDAFLALFAVGVVLGVLRALTHNIAACIGLHAGWVWVMLVTHELTRPVAGAAGAFLLSRFDGFVGWLALAWTVIVALPLCRWYAARRAGRE